MTFLAQALRLRAMTSDPMLYASVVVLTLMFGGAIVGPFVAPYDPTTVDLLSRFQGASAAHWLGTDEFGRDVFSRLLHGGRYTFGTGALAVFVGLAGGVPIGLMAGFFRPADIWLMQANDVLLALPAFWSRSRSSRSSGPVSRRLRSASASRRFRCSRASRAASC